MDQTPIIGLCFGSFVITGEISIRGGLNPSVAYDLNDYYAALLENCRTTSEVAKLCIDMVTDYMDHVQLTKAASAISPPIQSVCYYIQKHITEPLTIADLAKQAGYTEYYFSHKFIKETGFSVKEFILNEKIAQAKLLLSGTGQSIQEISDALGFSSRSYFYVCFQKKVGMSPSQYKMQHAKF